MQVKVGCCGFPVARRLYYRTFPVVEVQQTFYHPPLVATAARWREEAPEEFEFVVKAWQLITHQPSSPTYRRLRQPIAEERRGAYGRFQLTPEVQEAWARTAEVATALGARVVLFQCPASFTCSEENVANLRAFMNRVDRRGFLFAWEPRGGWPAELIRDLCVELELIHAVDPFKSNPLWGKPAYFRLHGITGAGYRFSHHDFAQLASVAKQAGEAYCLFNNVAMHEDAGRFMEFMKKTEAA
ncbi:MAG: DUF72 domain-containing protein [candidate division KSB1 bacterium]|nr:DUF72 domain-containing protein [candidate division KSB1 bacterium]MDZ7385012.1 DUF72 domain-containing protein [candidate division KSB1 bacterium]